MVDAVRIVPWGARAQRSRTVRTQLARDGALGEPSPSMPVFSPDRDVTRAALPMRPLPSFGRPDCVEQTGQPSGIRSVRRAFRVFQDAPAE